jgi:hypothetical protein
VRGDHRLTKRRRTAVGAAAPRNCRLTGLRMVSGPSHRPRVEGGSPADLGRIGPFCPKPTSSPTSPCAGRLLWTPGQARKQTEVGQDPTRLDADFRPRRRARVACSR